MIIPISLVFAISMAIQKKRRSSRDKTVQYRFSKIFPWFILGFIGASLLNTLGLFHPAAVSILSGAGKFLIIMALSAVGLSADFRKMARTGLKPLLLGLIVWGVIAGVSVAVQFFTGQI